MKKTMLILSIASTSIVIVSGCGNREPPSVDYVQMWLSLYYSPLEKQASSAYMDIQAGKTPSIGMSKQFDRKDVYGKFTLLTTRGAALLLDSNGQGLWAGDWAIPVRFEGKVAGLLLLKARSGEPWYGLMFYTLWMALENAEPYRWATIPTDGPYPKSIKLPSPKIHCAVLGEVAVTVSDTMTPSVLDIDGDGSDEIIIVSPEIEETLASHTTLQWAVELYSLTSSNPEHEIPLFEEDANKNRDCNSKAASTSSKATMRLDNVLTIPTDVEASAVSWKPGNAKGTLDVYCWKDDKSHLLGTFCKDTQNGNWKFMKAGRKNTKTGD